MKKTQRNLMTFFSAVTKWSGYSYDDMMGSERTSEKPIDDSIKKSFMKDLTSLGAYIYVKDRKGEDGSTHGLHVHSNRFYSLWTDPSKVSRPSAAAAAQASAPTGAWPGVRYTSAGKPHLSAATIEALFASAGTVQRQVKQDKPTYVNPKEWAALKAELKRRLRDPWVKYANLSIEKMGQPTAPYDRYEEEKRPLGHVLYYSFAKDYKPLGVDKFPGEPGSFERYFFLPRAKVRAAERRGMVEAGKPECAECGLDTPQLKDGLCPACYKKSQVKKSQDAAIRRDKPFRPWEESKERLSEAARTFDKPSVLRYMRLIASRHVDPKTGEVNATSLAEEAADYFDKSGLRGPLDDETHWIWDLAAKVAEEEEARTT